MAQIGLSTRAAQSEFTLAQHLNDPGFYDLSYALTIYTRCESVAAGFRAAGENPILYLWPRTVHSKKSKALLRHVYARVSDSIAI